MKTINFFGLFEIERKTSLLALVAFLLSLSSVFYQISVFLRGPDIKLFQPEEIMIGSIGGDIDKDYLSIIAGMSYVNSGETGYNGVVLKETISFKLGNSEYKFHWRSFVSSWRDSSGLTVNTKEEAHPFPVMAGNAESHETLFSARRNRNIGTDIEDINSNFIKVSDFLIAFMKQKKLELSLQAITEDEEILTITCETDFSDPIKQALGHNGEKWVTVSCWPK